MKLPVRFPRWVFLGGDEPDVRFTLANERTFLAWMRTALALIAGGVALEALGLSLEPGLRLAAAIVLVVAGLLTPIGAWFDWMTTERALRRALPLPHSPLGILLAIVVVVVGILVLLSMVLG